MPIAVGVGTSRPPGLLRGRRVVGVRPDPHNQAALLQHVQVAALAAAET